MEKENSRGRRKVEVEAQTTIIGHCVLKNQSLVRCSSIQRLTEGGWAYNISTRAPNSHGEMK